MKHYITLLLLSFIFLGCARNSTVDVGYDGNVRKNGALALACDRVSPKDEELLPEQSLYLACSHINCDTSVLEESRQEEFAKKLNSLYYGVWDSDFKVLDAKEALWGNGYAKSRVGYGQNLKPYTEGEIELFIERTSSDSFPNFITDGIVIHNTNFRVMPTNDPFFYNPKKAGEGYPFDYFQNSKVYFGTPLKILHISRDRGWVYAQSYFVSGWLDVKDIALVDEEFKERYKSTYLATPVHDNLLLQERLLIEKLKLGTLLPLDQEGNIYYPTKSGSRAVLQKTKMNGHFAKIPLKSTMNEIAKIGDEMLGSKYGWGSYPEGRDCSMMVRDLLIPFGVYLPRNSRSQAFYANGEYTDLSGMSDEKKEEYILKHGVPFVTLLYMKGHIMLYIGGYKGRALIYHDVWGVKKEAGGCDNGRHIIGGAVVSYLDVGKELEGVNEDRLIIKKIEGMKIIK